MAEGIIRVRVHGHMVEVGCYGCGNDWVCRLTDRTTQPRGHVADDYCPPPDLGFVWFREAGGMWVVSGLVNQKVFRDADTLDAVLSRVTAKVIGRDEQFARCIEFVSTEFTAMFDGELGDRQEAGGWAAVRWKNG